MFCNNEYDITNASLALICKNYNVDLLRDRKTDIFTIKFKSISNIPIKQLINFSIYQTIADINTDLLEKIEITNIIKEDEEANILFLFKDFCRELGIGKKYMYINVKREVINNNYIFKSTHLEYEYSQNLIKKGYSKIINEISIMDIMFLNDNEFNIVYSFKFDINEHMPFYMQNMPGMIMKKIFVNLKNLIETNNK